MRYTEYGNQNPQTVILPGLRHGDLSINRPKQYVKILTDWIGA